MTSSIIIGLAGILTAFIFYGAAPIIPSLIAKILKPLYLLSNGKFYVDEMYSLLIVRPFRAAAERVLAWFDQNIVDGLVNFAGVTTGFSAAVIRRLQTGYVQNYLLILFAGVLGLLYLAGKLA